jgi:segregation and condensation protein B
VGPWVRRFFQQRNRTRLSPAALETLAIVAYRQPVTGPEIQAIRGKDPGAALKGLLDKKLVRCLGRKKVVGSPLLYGTPREFLVHFGLNSLEDLPSIEDFDQFLEVLDARPEPSDSAPAAAVATAATSDESLDAGPTGPPAG